MAFDHYDLWDTHTLLGVYREVLSPAPLADGARVATRVQGE